MRVLSVNIGSSREVEIRGRTVSTSIFKSAVSGPQSVGRIGIQGDSRVAPRKLGEADHAVHIYPFEHYAFWERYLGREPGHFPYGQFGENLTTTGLLETEMRVGDVLRVGTAALQVVYPRVPCRKLDRRMERPGFKRTFLASRRVGFYLRVLQEGQLEAGDPIELMERDAASPTLDTFTRVAQFDYWDVHGLEHLLTAKGLSPEWHEVLSDKLDRARRAEGWFGARELEILGKHDEGDGAVSFDLRCARGRPLPRFRPGQDLTVVLRAPDSQTSERRSLPLTGDPEDLSCYRVVAAPARGNAVDELLHGLERGDTLPALAPFGTFTLDAVSPSCSRLLFVSEEIGIASFVGMLRALSRRRPPLHTLLLHRAPGPSFSRLVEEAEAIARTIPEVAIRHLSGDFVEIAGDALGRDTHAFIAGTAAFVERTAACLVPSIDRSRLQLKRTA